MKSIWILRAPGNISTTAPSRDAIDRLLGSAFELRFFECAADLHRELESAGSAQVAFPSALILDPEEMQKLGEGDPVSLTVRSERGRTETLTAKEFQIYSALRRGPVASASRETLLSQVWNLERTGSNTVDVHISNLRKKLNAIGIEILFEGASTYRLASRV